MRPTLRAFAALVLLYSAAPAHAVQPVFDPNGASFYDLPFPHELRRDPDGTVALSTFPFPVDPLIAAYAASLEEVPGFGLNSGVFMKFDGTDRAIGPRTTATSSTWMPRSTWCVAAGSSGCGCAATPTSC